MKKIYVLFLAFMCQFFTASTYAQNQSALDFDGVDDAVVMTGAAQLVANSSTLSISCWAKLSDDATNSPRGLIGVRDDISADFYIAQLSTTEIEARFRNSSNQFFTIDHIGGFQVNAWEHFALTYDGAMMRLYIGGVQVDSLAASGQFGSSTGDFQIGYSEWHPSFGSPDRFELLGQLDEVGLWKRALDSEEIQCIKNTRISENSDSLLAYFDFNQGAPAADNTAQLILQNALSTGDATISGFALNGASSNFVQGNTYAVNTQVNQVGISLIAQNSTATYQWINCTTNQNIPSAINQSYTPTVNGSYAAVISQCGISDTSDCFDINTVGLNEIENHSEMTLYPNPAAANFYITLPASAGMSTVRIFSMLGELVFNKTYSVGELNHSSISLLASGTYLVEVQSGTMVWNKKLIVLP
ncbi:MAG: hypothetical protein RLZZ543_2017 [Bacteroidota bacterium]|jgi:hypothetical protein